MARRRFLESLVSILLGSVILAFGFYNFYYLNNITEGGVLGLLLLLKNLFGIQPSIANIIIDGALLLIGYKFFGKKFFIYSIIASISFSFSYECFEYIGPILPNIQSMLISTILAGISVGIGVGIIVRAGGAAGGDDALALVIAKTTSLNIGMVYLLGDVVVLLLSLFYLSAYDVFYSLIAVTISGKIIDFIYYHSNNNKIIENV
ncbi:YitT family protein [Romboutsia sedimentorum]|uniref:YitT family protein n=1 Tax=Romboutsia sedimentorum TaxID=1368474 RepID=A0ABT7EAY6_9FIRM|nr:YitT family protein [Romboutsia sedimentorum]MDK2564090.1 YitT family protein [Romboutsia sedimentorum]MDK2587297.1 YitT family protein [Romboutsia sedimentorum]